MTHLEFLEYCKTHYPEMVERHTDHEKGTIRLWDMLLEYHGLLGMSV